jgi:hypothetical protein
MMSGSAAAAQNSGARTGSQLSLDALCSTEKQSNWLGPMERYYYALVPAEAPDSASCPGMALIATLPYWVFVERASELDPFDVVCDEGRIRVFAPFRSAPANFVPLPEVNLPAIPFPAGAPVTFDGVPSMSALAVMPNLENGQQVLAWGREWGTDVRYLPMDSLRLDAYPPAMGPASASVRRHLVSALRHHTRQWWIGRSLTGVVDITRAGFGVADDGSVVGPAHLRGSTSHLFGDERGVDAELWHIIAQDVKSRTEQSPSFDLLLDARWFAVSEDYRRAVLEAAIACELQVKTTFSQLLRSRGVRFSEGKHLRGPGLKEWITADLARVFQRNLGADAQSHIDWVARLWDARGRIAHGGPTAYLVDGTLYPIDGQIIIHLLYAAEQVVLALIDISSQQPG